MPAAREPAADLLAARAHSARLLGREPGLVLDGGGNASLKTPVDGVDDALADCGKDALLWVTPSGADLGGLSAEDFVPLDLAAVRALRDGPPLDEAGLVAALAGCRVRPSDPAPSIESLLHGWLPARFVDHSHAAAVQAVGNCEGGEAQLRGALGGNVAVVPALASGDPVARAAAAAWESGAAFPSAGVLVLRHHGIVCWGETAESCWAAHLGAVERAEAWLNARGAVRPAPALASERAPAQAEAVEAQRQDLEEQSGIPWHEVAVDPRFFELPDARARAQSGPVTPGDLLRLGLRPLWLPEEAWRPGRHAALSPELGAAFAGGPEESAARAAAAVLENDLATRLRSSALGSWRSLSLSACEEAMASLLEQLKVSRKALGQP